LGALPVILAGSPGFFPLNSLAQPIAGGISGIVNSDTPADAPGANQPSDISAAAAVAASAPATPPEVHLYGGTEEIAKLAQAGVGQTVMLAYVTNTGGRFALTPDQIIYLNDLGVSGTVITAMLQHDAVGSTAAPAPAIAPDTAALPATEPPAPDNFTPPPATEPATYPDTGYPPAYTDQTPEYPAGYPAASDAGYFYDSLAPYGNWMTVPGYGPCWQPTVVVGDPGWRPYHDRGRWLYTDSGWYWQSDYSWGWAAFHYGRWARQEHLGWVWVPNREWGPGWVSWRTTGDYAGWAPLPPSARFDSGIGFIYQNRRVGAGFDFGLSSSFYTFIPVERLSDYAPIRYGVTRTTRDSIFGQSVVVNNLALVNQQVVNLGVNPERVEASGGTPVRRVHVREASTGDNRFRTDRLERRGDSLVISRPQLPVNNSTVAHSIRVQTAAAATTVPVWRTTSAPAVSSVRVNTPEAAATLASIAASPARVHVTYYRQSEITPATASVSTPAANHQPYRPGALSPEERRNLLESQPADQRETASPAPAENRATSHPLSSRDEFARSYSPSDNPASVSDGRTVRSGSVPPLFATGAERDRAAEGEVTRDDRGQGFPGAPGQTLPARQAPAFGRDFGSGYSRAPSAPAYSPPSSSLPSSSAPAQTYSAPARSYSGPAQTYTGPAQTYSGPSQSYHGSAPTSSASSSQSSRNR
jgi:hypothetical protein